MTTTIAPSVVLWVCGLLWLAEAARDTGVEITCLLWLPGTGHNVVTADEAGAKALAERIGARRDGLYAPYWVGDWDGFKVTIQAPLAPAGTTPRMGQQA